MKKGPYQDCLTLLLCPLHTSLLVHSEQHNSRQKRSISWNGRGRTKVVALRRETREREQGSTGKEEAIRTRTYVQEENCSNNNRNSSSSSIISSGSCLSTFLTHSLLGEYTTSQTTGSNQRTSKPNDENQQQAATAAAADCKSF